MSGGRPVARFVAVLGLLVLGAAALSRLPLDYLPRQSFPELTVGLSLPEDVDPGEVVRAWLAPVEGAIRSLGRVRAAAGEVWSDGAELTVRFAPGTDAGRKAARLESELARLRRRLPAGASLWVEPASDRQGEFLAIVWLSGARDDEDAHAVAEELRGVPGVREVELFGAAGEEVRVVLPAGELDPWGLAETVRGEAARALRVPALGRVDRNGRRWPLVVKSRGEDLARLAIPVGGSAVPLGALASIQARSKPPESHVRFAGEPARALFVWRAHGAPLLAVERALRDRLAALPGRVRGTIGWSDADPLRFLVRRLTWGGLLLSALAATLGAMLAGRRGALALALMPPAVAAAAANAFWLGGIPLHITTLVALAVAVAALLPLAALRLTQRRGFWPYAATALAASAVVPVAVSLASAELGPLLAEPARALVLAVGSGVLTLSLLPLSRGGGDGPGGRVRRWLKAPLRDPATAVLFAATAAFGLLAVFGGALAPRPGDLRPDRGDLTAVLRLPQGATLAETVARARKAEEKLAAAGEVERVWSYSVPGRARVVAEIRPEDRRPDRLRRLGTRVEYELAALASVEVTAGPQASPQNGSGGRGFLADLEERAETDEEAWTYRVVLRSSDWDSLRVGYDRLLRRLESLHVRDHWIRGWGQPAVHLVLHPRAGTSPAEAAALAARLRQASTPPAALPLPGPFPGKPERSLTVVPAGTPEEPDRAVPQAAALLGRPVRLGGRAVAPAAAFTTAEEVVQDRVLRQSGRFVLPVEIQIPLNGDKLRRERRETIDRSLGQVPLPPACDLERPALSPWRWRRERLRMAALALCVPLLLFAIAACRLDAPGRALASLVPLGLGFLAAAPLVSASLGQMDELTLFALAAVLALTLPVAATAATAAEAASVTGARLYRSARRHAPWMLGTLPVLALALITPTLGADPHEHRWAMPLRAAAVAGGASLAVSAALVPALLLIGARLRTRDPEEVRRRRRPPAWEKPGAPSLEVRSLTKVYTGRTTALSGVSFSLTPGIVGLLGPNGAGKTTLLRILTGLIEPTRGAVLYRGLPIGPDNLSQYRRRIGFLPQEFNAYPDFTAEEFLDHWGMERGLSDPRERRREVERLLAAVDLSEHSRRKVRDFSGGMRQRVGIARALLAAPPILIVDEPTTGLDVESRSRFRQILLEQAGERIVIFSTHIASDVEAAASRILLLHGGRLRFDGTPEELLARARGRVFRALVGDADLAGFGQRFRITSRVRILAGIQVRAVAHSNDALEGELVEPNLEEAYLAELNRG